MIRKLVFSSCLVLLSACATSSKEETAQIPSIDGSSGDYPPPTNQSKNDSLDAPTKSGGSPGKPDSRAASVPIRNESQALIDAEKNNDFESIYKASTALLAKNPNDVKALNALGLYFAHKGRPSAALMMYGRALKISPNSSEVHNNLALTLLTQKENREALQEFRKALANNNDEGAAAANLGSIYVEHKSYTKALVANEIAYKKNSKDPKVLNNYGISLTGVGKYKEAKEIYQKAMSLNGENKDVIVNYAILLIDHLNQNQEGLDLINKARFLGISPEARNRINTLENKAKSGVK